ncbi:MAG: sortase [Minisyncoccia bacterium]|jgi:LPXTG-site transpeptidase (sortase) family protein
MRISNKILLIALVLCVSVVQASASGGTSLSTVPTADFTFTRNLALGIRGDDVSALQQFLIAGGFLEILAPTGYFGPLTRTALGAWQASIGVYPSVGFFGPISRGKINASLEPTPIDATRVPGTVGTTTTTVATTSMAVVNNGDGLPERFKIPKLNVDAGFQYTGLKPDGTMEIPTNIVDVGWFTGSPRPGEKGSSIITGHVAQIRGGVMTKPGVFSNLSNLQAGDKLYVINDKGESIAFVVRESRSYDPAADATDVFTSSDGGAHLNLITCEGTWNPAQLSYSQRLVVFTDLVQ